MGHTDARTESGDYMTDHTTEGATPEVRINGVLYVPVTESNPNVDALLDALVEQWAGEGWRESYADAPGYLRVVVGDDFESGEGESVIEFVARLLTHPLPPEE